MGGEDEMALGRDWSGWKREGSQRGKSDGVPWLQGGKGWA